MKKQIKSTIALVVMAIAMLFSSCSKDEAGLFGGIEVDENNNPVGTTYELLSSEHVTMAELSVSENVITIPCDHIAHFKSNVGDDTYDREYDVTNSATIGNTSIATEDISKITNQTYVWENGVFTIGESFLSMTFGETKVSKIRLGNQTFGKDDLSYCTIVAAKLILGDATEVESKKFQVPATIIFTMSCGEDEQVEWKFTMTVIETSEDDEITERIENVTLTDLGIEYDYVVEHTVNTELNSTTHFTEPVDFGLQAEERKIFDTENILSLNNPTPSINGKVYSFTWNLFVNKVTAAYPEEVTLRQGNATYTFEMPTPVVSMIGMSNSTSSDANYACINYTINYNMMVNGISVAKAEQEVSTRTKADVVNYTFENIEFTKNGVEYDFVEKHSVNTELNNSEHFVEKVNFSLSSEAKKVVNTEEALTLTSTAPSVNGKVYSFAWNLFKNNLTAAFPAQVTLSQKGQTYVYDMPQPAVKMQDMTQNAGQDATYNFVEYVITYVMTVNNIEVASATQLARTQNEIPVNPTIPGYHLLKANQCDYYTESRDGWVASPIYALFVNDNDDSQMLFVEFDENNGVEKSREALNGVVIPNFPLGRAYRTGEGTAPAYVQTNDTEYMWTSFTNKNFYSTVSVVSSVSQSLRNPIRSYGTVNSSNGTTTFILSNGEPLPLK